MGIKLCEKCGYRHSGGRCCINIYQQIGRTKGASVLGKVLIAFGIPIAVFLVTLFVAEHILSGLIAKGNLRTLITFLISLTVTILFVQLIRIFTKTTINTENKTNNTK